jgi:hypothetical protein
MADGQKKSAGSNVDSGPGSKSGKTMSGSAKRGSGDAGSDTEKSHDVTFAKGGDTHMFGEQSAGDQKPGGTAHTESAAPGADFASGGKTKMFGFSGALPARDGITSAR